MQHTIRQASPDEFRLLQEIEHESDAQFSSVGMPDIYERGHVLPLDELQDAYERKNLWAATDDNDRPVGWAMSVPVDVGLHIEQLCVLPQYQRRGIGRALFEALVGFARTNRFPQLTLSTFLDVPWNAPLYLKWGYRVLQESELSPDLRRIRQSEIDRGLDRMPRVCMVYYTLEP